jgi:hypothetical protein
MKSWPLILVVPLLLVAGCFSYGQRLEQQDVTPQTYEEKTETPMLVAPASIPTPDRPAVNAVDGGKVPDVKSTAAQAQVVTGPVVAYARTFRKFSGQGIHYFNDTKALRFMSPFGVSAGEVITEAAKKPATIAAGDTPMISMGADGSFKVGKGEDVKVAGTVTGGGILDSIITRVKDWGLIILVVIGAVIILPLIFPILSPIFSLIWNVLTGIWTWVKSAASAASTHIQAAIPVIETGVVSAWKTVTTTVQPVATTTTATVIIPTVTTTGGLTPISVPPASDVPSGNPSPVVVPVAAVIVPTVSLDVPVVPTVPPLVETPTTVSVSIPVVDPTLPTRPLNATP